MKKSLRIFMTGLLIMVVAFAFGLNAKAAHPARLVDNADLILDYEEELQMETLIHDEIVIVINQKYYTGEKDYLEEEVYRNQLKTQFNIEAVGKWENTTKVSFSACSNDADFHRAMLEKNDASVTMSGLSYQYFFNSKKYVALCLDDTDVAIIHAAVYRKDADETIQEIVRMIRKEMHLK